MISVGIFTGYYPYKMDEVIRRIKASDFNCVQLDVSFKDFDAAYEPLTEKKAHEIRDAFRDANLPVIAVSGYTNFIHPDPDIRKRNIDYLKMMLRYAPIDGSRGRIVNISSCSAYTSSVNRGEYCISKAGMSMITKLFADRLATEGITVNEICPGIIETGMTAGVKEKYDRMIDDGLIPLGRWGTPEDVAKAVLCLCDGTFGYTTGASIIVDGGLHIRTL